MVYHEQESRCRWLNRSAAVIARVSVEELNPTPQPRLDRTNQIAMDAFLSENDEINNACDIQRVSVETYSVFQCKILNIIVVEVTSAIL